METIKIEGKEYPVKFGLSTVQKFARKNGMESVEEFAKWYENIQEKGFVAIEQVGELLKMGFDRGAAKSGIPNTITADDIIDLTLDDPAEFQKLQTILQQSLESNIPEQEAIAGEGETEETKKN